MPVLLLSQDYVHRALRKKKCKFLKKRETCTVWKTASGVWFSVPFETPEERTNATTLEEILRDIQKWDLFTGTKAPERGL